MRGRRITREEAIRLLSGLMFKGKLKEALDMAIKALEQEPTTKNDLGVDCVPRIEVIDYLCKHCPDDGECFKDCDEIKHLRYMPSVTPQEPKWIPVSEGLPKIAGIYRVTRYYPNNVINPNYLVDACCFDGSNTWYDDNRINHERAYADNVIAWQENPEPYEPQESEE